MSIAELWLGEETETGYRHSRSKMKEGQIGTAAGVGRWSLGEMVRWEILSIFMAEGERKLLMEKGHCSIF